VSGGGKISLRKLGENKKKGRLPLIPFKRPAEETVEDSKKRFEVNLAAGKIKSCKGHGRSNWAHRKKSCGFQDDAFGQTEKGGYQI